VFTAAAAAMLLRLLLLQMLPFAVRAMLQL
jgi:hypothetical protein